MAIILDKTITRDSDNIIDTLTNYNDLNLKAGNLVDDIVSHVETEMGSAETQINTVIDAKTAEVDTRINSLASSSDTVYSTEYIDGKFKPLDSLAETAPLVDFSRVESYVATNGTRWLKNDGKGADGEMLSGQMLEFNGSNQYIDLGITEFESTNSSNITTYTISLNYTHNLSNVPQAFIGMWYEYSPVFGVGSDNLLYLYAGGANKVSSANIYYGTTKLELSKTYRIHMVVNGTSLSFYINGELDYTTTMDENYWFNLYTIGTSGNNNYGFNGGCIGNLSVVGTALTADDIALDYAQPELILGVATNTIQSPFSFDTNDILACFPLQEGTMGGGSVWDIKNSTSYPITNYNSTMWTNADNLPYGIQQTLLVKDDVNNFVTGVSKYACEVSDFSLPTLSPYYSGDDTEMTVSNTSQNSFNMNTSGAIDNTSYVYYNYNNDVTIEANTMYRVSFDYSSNSGKTLLDYVYLPNQAYYVAGLNYTIENSGTFSTLIYCGTEKILDSSEFMFRLDNTIYGVTYDINISNIKIEKVEYSELPQINALSHGTIQANELLFNNGIFTGATLNCIINYPDRTLRNTNTFDLLGYYTELGLSNVSSADYIRPYVDGLLGFDVTTIDYVMITLVCDTNNKASVYLNGELKSTKYVTIDDVAYLFKIGASESGLINTDAKFASITFDRKALNQFEINELYNNIKTNAPSLALP